jgi:hypothetical protein
MHITNGFAHAPIVSLVVAMLFAPAEMASQQLPTRQTRQMFRLGGPDAKDAYAFSQTPRLVVDSAGFIFARIASEGAVSIFGPDGAFVRTIGRKGQGPGEFEVAANHGLLGDTLWVSNWPTPRISRFLRDGTHITTVRTPFDYGRSFGGPVGLTALLPGGRAIVTPPSPVMGVDEPIHLPVIVGPVDMMRRDTIALTQTPRGLFIPSLGTWSFEPVRPSPYVTWASNGSGVAVASWHDSLPGVVDVRVIGADGTQRWRRSLHLSAAPIPRTVRDSLIAVGVEKVQPQMAAARGRGRAPSGNVRNLVEHGLRLPRHFAPVGRIVLGRDGALWIEQMDGLRTGNWLVLDRGGTPRFQVRLPSTFVVNDATMDSVWGTEQDDLGVAYLVRLRVVEG